MILIILKSGSSSESEAANDAADICFEVRVREDLQPVEADIVQKRCAELRKHMRQRPDLPCKVIGSGNLRHAVRHGGVPSLGRSNESV